MRTPRLSTFIRIAPVLIAVSAVVSCSGGGEIGANPTTPLSNSLFTSYVSLGNSITAGVQSGGINDSTQQQSYAVLIAVQMGTPFIYPSVNGGDRCRLIVNFVTKAENPSPPSGTPCSRNATDSLVIPNNVAVPGAASADPTNNDTPESTPLRALFLGNDTRAQAALDHHPSFVSIWIGNNDVLPFAVSGHPGGSTPQSTFVANYDAMTSQLVAGAPTAKGILIGAVNVANAPILFTSAALQTRRSRANLSQMAGKTITIDRDVHADRWVAHLACVVTDVASGALPPVISCTGGSSSASDDVLTVSEQAQVAGIVTGYNAFIEAKADSLGWAYWDPNPLLEKLKAQGLIPDRPALTSATAPFGTYITLDGVHPSATGQVLIANALIDAINAKFGTTLSHVP